MTTLLTKILTTLLTKILTNNLDKNLAHTHLRGRVGRRDALHGLLERHGENSVHVGVAKHDAEGGGDGH